MKLFRWSGLIGFVVFTALLSVIGLFFLDNWTRKAVEAAGFSVNGAEVNVANVDLTLSPLGFRFEDVQVADAEKPTHNVVEIGQMRLEINFAQLFLGNVRLQDVTVADVKTQTERRRPARIASTEDASGDIADDSPGVVAVQAERIAGELPAAGDVVDQQTEQTRTAVNDAKETIAESRQRVNAAAQNVPGDDALADYRARTAAIRKQEINSLDDLKRMRTLVAELSADVAEDKLAVENVKVQMNQAISEARKAMDEVTAAPGKDWAQLKADYPLNQESAMKVARLLVGDAAFEKLEQATYWYGKAKPWIERLAPKNSEEENRPERLDGEFVRYPHPDPTARFQLDQALVSFVADNWPWTMTVQDLTSHRGDNFIPTKLALQRGTDDNSALEIDAILDRIDGQSVDTVNLSGQGISFASRTIGLGDASVNWLPEPADMTGMLKVTDGALDGEVVLDFAQNSFDVSGNGVTARYVRQALASIESFDMTIRVQGTVKKPKLSIASNLDNQLGDALSDVAKAEYDAWLADVRAQLDQKVAELRAPVDEAQASLTQRRDDVLEQIQQFEADVVAELKTLEDKVASEQKRLENRLADEKRKAEDAARKEAEDKLKEEADKLKDKFSF